MIQRLGRSNRTGRNRWRKVDYDHYCCYYRRLQAARKWRNKKRTLHPPHCWTSESPSSPRMPEDVRLLADFHHLAASNAPLFNKSIDDHGHWQLSSQSSFARYIFSYKSSIHGARATKHAFCRCRIVLFFYRSKMADTGRSQPCIKPFLHSYSHPSSSFRQISHFMTTFSDESNWQDPEPRLHIT